MVLSVMVPASSQQRQLLDYSTKAATIQDQQRYAYLALKASREVARAAAVWNELRMPPKVQVGPGGQANVVGGDQVIETGASNQ